MDELLTDIMWSNTLAGSSNQTYFFTENQTKNYTGMVFYRVENGGKYLYSFLFSAKTDSSFPIENLSECNADVFNWTILKAEVAVCKDCEPSSADNFLLLRFDGNERKTMTQSSAFWSDGVILDAQKNQYICLKITYNGKKIPHHYENTIPAFVQTENGWISSNKAVFANCVACNRRIKAKITYLGDSITQGIGVPNNSYKNWCALLSEKLGSDYGYWNLGIGFGMAHDAATNGAWLEKAKQSDVVFVCYGVNDIFRINNANTIKNDLFSIVEKLKQSNCKVVLQTVPPFDYKDEHLKIWIEVNEYIKTELVDFADLILDCAPFLEGEESGKSKYGNHPNEEGCRKWVDGIYNAVREFLLKLK